MSELRKKQLDAEQAWEYLQSKNVPNLDIERQGMCKVTLVELLAEFAKGVYLGSDNRALCGRCGRPEGEHARESLSNPNQHDWKWGKNACPVGDGPFHPTQVFELIKGE